MVFNFVKFVFLLLNSDNFSLHEKTKVLISFFCITMTY
ncbi:hypothetical protein YpsIP31758_3283 [Yersinia pseudotuberculosis IP 31758]|uniref:Uncharacterized protein n=1 Tax=Yersinia pseudotuberculosis serotype O:1b (strain IP 31758) TaxID=349747 RepID=A0A0U1QXI8_YERP3|nr:hypothetical protein YpsIP31758_3283 [Yersinia pseudotuberculosis IP 31758]